MTALKISGISPNFIQRSPAKYKWISSIDLGCVRWEFKPLINNQVMSKQWINRLASLLLIDEHFNQYNAVVSIMSWKFSETHKFLIEYVEDWNVCMAPIRTLTKTFAYKLQSEKLKIVRVELARFKWLSKTWSALPEIWFYCELDNSIIIARWDFDLFYFMK